nr:MAG TPA: hypothetical protein [Bacteriophage sp.]
MTRDQLAAAIADGLLQTHIEGRYDSVSRSTGGDYPSIGCSQWEGDRADRLLSMIPDGNYYAGRSYSDIAGSGDDLHGLSLLLDSQAGRDAQTALLREDCLSYVDAIQQVPDMDQTRPAIYAGMWCPTSTSVVCEFLRRRQARGYNLRSLEAMRDMFADEYGAAAGGYDYGDRAINTYYFCAGLNPTDYGE